MSEWRSGQKMRPERRQLIIDLIKLGFPAHQIHLRTGSSASSILKIMRGMGRESPYITAQRIRREEIQKNYNPANKPYIEARRLGYHWATVERALQAVDNG